eukprot:943634-Rhodomonas_salina.3
MSRVSRVAAEWIPSECQGIRSESAPGQANEGPSLPSLPTPPPVGTQVSHMTTIPRVGAFEVGAHQGGYRRDGSCGDEGKLARHARSKGTGSDPKSNTLTRILQREYL